MKTIISILLLGSMASAGNVQIGSSGDRAATDAAQKICLDMQSVVVNAGELKTTLSLRNETEAAQLYQRVSDGVLQHFAELNCSPLLQEMAVKDAEKAARSKAAVLKEKEVCDQIKKRYHDLWIKLATDQSVSSEMIRLETQAEKNGC